VVLLCCPCTAFLDVNFELQVVNATFCGIVDEVLFFLDKGGMKRSLIFSGTSNCSTRNSERNVPPDIAVKWEHADGILP
jgi:hypothetical protein